MTLCLLPACLLLLASSCLLLPLSLPRLLTCSRLIASSLILPDLIASSLASLPPPSPPHLLSPPLPLLLGAARMERKAELQRKAKEAKEAEKKNRRVGRINQVSQANQHLSAEQQARLFANH